MTPSANRKELAQARMRLAYRLVAMALDADPDLLYDPNYRQASGGLLPWREQVNQQKKGKTG